MREQGLNAGKLEDFSEGWGSAGHYFFLVFSSIKEES